MRQFIFVTSLFFLLPLLSGLGCSRETSSPDSPAGEQDAALVDGSRVNLPAAPDATFVPDVPDGTAGECQAQLVLRGNLKIIGDPSCTLVEAVSSSAGTMKWPCEGGSATATYTDGIDTWLFEGTVTPDGTVTLSVVKPFDWYGAGCEHWQSTQSLKGSLGTGELAFRYDEKVLTAGCSLTACSGEGSVAIVRSKGP